MFESGIRFRFQDHYETTSNWGKHASFHFHQIKITIWVHHDKSLLSSSIEPCKVDSSRPPSHAAFSLQLLIMPPHPIPLAIPHRAVFVSFRRLHEKPIIHAAIIFMFLLLRFSPRSSAVAVYRETVTKTCFLPFLGFGFYALSWTLLWHCFWYKI